VAALVVVKAVPVFCRADATRQIRLNGIKSCQEDEGKKVEERSKITLWEENEAKKITP
jgi:hypothetical protein